MALESVRSWTLAGLLVAFCELFVAYFLLCGSTYAFFLSKFFCVFGLYLPCPCIGIFGYQNSNLCLHKLLFDWPTRKVIYVQELVKSRFPFDLIWFRDQSCCLGVKEFRDEKCENGVMEMEEEACTSSLSGPRFQSLAGTEGGYNAKRKQIVNQKQKSGIQRRRKRASLGPGKLLSGSTRLVGAGVLHAPTVGKEGRIDFSECLDPANGVEDCFLEVGTAPGGIIIDERIQHRIEINKSYEKEKGVDRDSSSVEKTVSNAECRLGNDGNVVNAIRMLEKELEKEKATHIALYQELEKERAAAATAADEAMAMIFRLQEDKASLEMEVRQYQRMTEEKFAYDEEEINILKEILVTREKENHSLEKEVEGYRQMILLGNKHLEGELSYRITTDGRRLSHSNALNENPLLLSTGVEKSKFVSHKDVATNASWSSNYEPSSNTPDFGRDMTSEQLASSLSTSERLVEEKAELARGEKEQGNNCIMSQEMKISQTFDGIKEEPQRDGEHWNQVSRDMQGSMFDTESTVYDIHVVDDKTTAWNLDGIKQSIPSDGSASDSSVWSHKVLNDCPSTSIAEHETNVHGRSIDTSSQLHMLGDLRVKTLGIDFQENSSQVESERLKIYREVERLSERLRIVQEEKENFTLSAENQQRVSAQLKLVEEIVNHLREIQLLR
uniref:Uncharacterized protein MANES_13G047500 n=2 Tax=Rhizophora mucronata TaxID=61149 RepID=A0A2P2K4C2_RHIMU